MIELTKWPQLQVVGEQVTRAQANEILLRTNQWEYTLSTNDRAWAYDIIDVLELTRSNDRNSFIPATMHSLDDLNQRLGVLDLSYLSNQRISSAWIGGPHGWCDWDGTIYTASYNIGKWPTVEDVTEDWYTIAEAFPYLNLRAQLLPDEGEQPPAVEWTVKNGSVKTNFEPSTQLAVPGDWTANERTLLGMVRGLRSPGRERGVSLDRLREAYVQVMRDCGHDL